MFQALVKKFLVLAILFPSITNSQTLQSYHPPIFTDPNRLGKINSVFPLIDSMYQQYAEANHFPGYIFAIIVDGKMVHVGKGGYADLEKKIPVDLNTQFRIASMTKSFTAMAIIKLRDEGKLKLDDPVSLYVPALKNQKLTQDSPEITIRDLLTHSAGFPEDNPWGDRNLNMTDVALIDFLTKGISFSNATATHYEYSNLGFAILGLIIKSVSGVPYEDYIRSSIWEPLNMQAVNWEYANVSPKELAHGYKWDNGHWVKEELLHDGIFGAMGGMITSVGAFSHYVALHQTAWPARDEQESGPLKRSSVREMQQPWRFNTFNAHAKFGDQECATMAAYGYGLKWLRDCQDKTYIGHSGGLPGFGSNWVILPEYGIGVILFANTTYAPADAINLRVINKLIEKAHLKPRQLPASQRLNEIKEKLMALLPDWHDAKNSGLFAANFFLDNSLTSLQEETRRLFAKAGSINRIGGIIPENQLRGYFMVRGEKTDLKISFTLSPDKPALIQSFHIEEILKSPLPDIGIG